MLSKTSLMSQKRDRTKWSPGTKEMSLLQTSSRDRTDFGVKGSRELSIHETRGFVVKVQEGS